MTTRRSKRRRPAFENMEGGALLSAGALDTSFGGTGEVVNSLGVSFDVQGVAVQPDLKTVVVGYEMLGTGDPATEYPVMAIRYNVDGSLDTSFGNGGLVQVPNASGGFGNPNCGDHVAIQANGDIVIATNAKTYDSSTGAVTSAHLLVARLNPDGTLDTTFGNEGETLLQLPSGGVCAVGLAVLPAGQIVVAGTVQPTLGGPAYTVARLTSIGAVDTTFGPNGQGYNDVAVVAPTQSVTSYTANTLAVDPAGNLLVGGTWVNSAGVRTDRIVRYTPTGLLDTSFSNQGVVDLSYSALRGIDSIGFEPGGQIVAALDSASIVELNSDGTVDTGFASNGVFSNGGITLAVQPDGKIVAASQQVNTSNEYLVNRILSNGTLDPSFGVGGTSVMSFPNSGGAPGQLVIGPDGKITGAFGFNLSLFRLLNDITVTTTGQVAVTQQPPSSLTAGTPFSLTVQVDDSSGNLESSYNGTLTVSVAGGPGGLGGTLTATASGGVATFSGLSLTAAGSDTLIVSGDSLASATTSAISVSPAAPAQVVVTQQPPSSVTAGSAFGLTAAIEDAYGNVVTDTSGTVTVALAGGPAGATLGGTLSASTSNGVATFSGLTLTQAASGYTLSVATSGLSGGTTGAFTVAPAAATQLVIVQQPSGVRVNQAFTVVVAIEDAYGNVVTNANNSVSVAFGNNPTRAKLGGTTRVTAKNGYATFSNLTVSRAGSGYTLVFSSSGLSSVKTSAFSAS